VVSESNEGQSITKIVEKGLEHLAIEGKSPVFLKFCYVLSRKEHVQFFSKKWRTNLRNL